MLVANETLRREVEAWARAVCLDLEFVMDAAYRASDSTCRLLAHRAASSALLAPAYKAAALERGCLVGSPDRRGLAAVSSVLVDGAMQAQGAGGPGAYARRSFVAADQLSGRRYVAALVEPGGTMGLGASALAAPPGCPAILVFCLQAGTLDTVAWAVNLQANASAGGALSLSGVAASPATGGLLLAGDFAGQMAFGAHTLTAAGGTDAFAAELSPADGHILWAGRYGGPGRDSGLAVAATPAGDALLVGASAPAPTLLTLNPNRNSTAAAAAVAAQATLFFARLSGGPGLGAVAATAAFPAGPAPPAEARVSMASGSATAAIAYTVAGPAALRIGGEALAVGAAEAGLVVLDVDMMGALAGGPPLLVTAARAGGSPQLLLGDLVQAQGGTYVAAMYVGQALLGSSTAPLGVPTPDAFSDGLLLGLAPNLSVSWHATVGGPGAQAPGALAAQPNGSAIYAIGSAWSAAQVTVASTSGVGAAGASTALASFQSRELQPGEGAFVMQLDAAMGAVAWVKLLEGWQEARPSCTYEPARPAAPDAAQGAAPPSDALLCAGLFDLNAGCKRFGAGLPEVCAAGPRPFYVSALPLPPRVASAAALAYWRLRGQTLAAALPRLAAVAAWLHRRAPQLVIQVYGLLTVSGRLRVAIQSFPWPAKSVGQEVPALWTGQATAKPVSGKDRSLVPVPELGAAARLPPKSLADASCIMLKRCGGALVEAGTVGKLHPQATGVDDGPQTPFQSLSTLAGEAATAAPPVHLQELAAGAACSLPEAPSASSREGSGPDAADSVRRSRRKCKPRQSLLGEAGSSDGPLSRRAAAAAAGALMLPAAALVPKMARGGGAPPAGLARCFVLVAKALTRSDTNGRIILPRVSVEANMTFLVGYKSYTLPTVDHTGRQWEFVVKSWANGSEHRRVFVLEQAGPFIRAYGLGEGDCIGICTDAAGALVIEVNTEAVRAATIRPMYGAMAATACAPTGSGSGFAQGPAVLGSIAAPAGPKPYACIQCGRNASCDKPCGHPGFCSGPRVSGGRVPALAGRATRAALVDAARRAAAAAGLKGGGEAAAAPVLEAGSLPVGMRLECALSTHDVQSGQVLLPARAGAGGFLRGAGARVGDSLTLAVVGGELRIELEHVGEPDAMDTPIPAGLGAGPTGTDGPRWDALANGFAGGSNPAGNVGPDPAEVGVMCGGLVGVYDLAAGVISVRYGADGRICTKRLSPAEFEQQAGAAGMTPGSTQIPMAWQQTILVDAPGPTPGLGCGPGVSGALRRALSSDLPRPTRALCRPEAEDEGLAAEVLMSRFGMLEGGCPATPRFSAPWLAQGASLDGVGWLQPSPSAPDPQEEALQRHPAAGRSQAEAAAQAAVDHVLGAAA
ncbi:hypothetical protein WJX81_000533 [Elliptochloris bilobata]|uniref:B30.2/SPRY domain-containing protein n=1 Tax=Elliptochloris bilobata TaxID=381761 RepID=A0AAW1RR21_9CHLO